MADAVIVSTARTPLCKSWRGALNMTHGATLGGTRTVAAIAGTATGSAPRRSTAPGKPSGPVTTFMQWYTP